MNNVFNIVRTNDISKNNIINDINDNNNLLKYPFSFTRNNINYN